MSFWATDATKPFWPGRSWWMVLLAILVLAGGFRYIGYNFSLPYLAYVDEPTYNLAGRMIIDFGSAKPLGMQGYPPGIVMMNYVLLRLFQDPADPPSTIIGSLRLISITFGLLSIVMMALLGYRIASPLSGLVAAALWTFIPQVVECSRYATGDNFVTFFTLMALFLCLTGTLYDRDKWTTYGLVSVMMAIVFKYQAVFILPVIGAFPLVRIWHYRKDRTEIRRILRNSVNHLVILGLFFFWLVLLFPSLEANDAPDFSGHTDRLGIPMFSDLRYNLHSLLDHLLPVLVWCLGGLGLCGLLWPAFRKHTNFLALIAMVTAGFLWWIGVGFFGVQSFRQFIAVSAMCVLVASIGLSFWAEALAYALQRLGKPSGLAARGTLISAAILTGLLIVLNWSNIDGTIANTRNHTLPDRRNDLATYADTSLKPGKFISQRDYHKVLSRDWGGYSGINLFPLEQVVWGVTERSIDEWRALGVDYAILSYGSYEQLVQSEVGQAYLDNMLLLKSYPPSDQFRDPTMAILRFYPIQNEISGQLGPVQLIGYDISRTEVRPGQEITFTLYWQASSALDADYVVYNHLTPLNSTDIVAQVDGPPLYDERRSTQSWNDPSEILVSRTFQLVIDPEVKPGKYHIFTGFYRRDNWQRLISANGDDFLEVATITVEYDR